MTAGAAFGLFYLGYSISDAKNVLEKQYQLLLQACKLHSALCV